MQSFSEGSCGEDLRHPGCIRVRRQASLSSPIPVPVSAKICENPLTPHGTEDTLLLAIACSFVARVVQVCCLMTCFFVGLLEHRSSIHAACGFRSVRLASTCKL
jgi:hypothetical protein